MDDRDQLDLRVALEEGFAWIECDFEDIRKYRDAVPLARDKEAKIFLAPPRIHKPGEPGILRNVLGAGQHPQPKLAGIYSTNASCLGGGAQFRLDQSGVTIKGLTIKIEGMVKVDVKGLMTTVTADAMLTAKGAITLIN